MLTPIGGWRFKSFLRAWLDWFYEGLLPPELPPDQTPKVIYDWSGKCKLCRRPKEDLTEVEWL